MLKFKSMSVIEIKGLTKYYGTQKALDEIHLIIEGGGVLGLLGPNGAGKSTLMKIMVGLLMPTSGQVLMYGQRLDAHLKEMKKRVGYLPENNPLYPEMYVREYLSDVLKMYENNSDVDKRIDQVVKQTGLDREQHKLIGNLSKGYQQRVGLAQALVHDPDILILDEPTTGLDPNQLIEIRRLIADLGKKKTIVLSTHIMQEVEAICDRVVILNQGKLIADEPLDRPLHQGKQFRLLIKESIPAYLFDEIPHLISCEQKNDGEWLLRADPEHDIREAIFRFAVAKGLNILSFSEVENRIESVFHELTSN